MINPNEPFMPLQYKEEVGNNGHMIKRVFEGLTIRQYFAAMAMQGMLANPQIMELGTPDTLMNIVSVASVEHADDLIAELDKT